MEPMVSEARCGAGPREMVEMVNGWLTAHHTTPEACTNYPVYYDQSKAAEVIRGSDYNEGRAFFTPATVDKCMGAGSGQHGSKFSSCQTVSTKDSTTAYGQRRAQWSTATKNQNMGMKVCYLGSICMPALCF